MMYAYIIELIGIQTKLIKSVTMTNLFPRPALDLSKPVEMAGLLNKL